MYGEEMTLEERKIEFIKGYKELCEKYGLYIHCNCIEEPFIMTKEAVDKDYNAGYEDYTWEEMLKKEFKRIEE